MYVNFFWRFDKTLMLTGNKIRKTKSERTFPSLNQRDASQVLSSKSRGFWSKIPRFRFFVKCVRNPLHSLMLMLMVSAVDGKPLYARFYVCNITGQRFIYAKQLLARRGTLNFSWDFVYDFRYDFWQVNSLLLVLEISCSGQLMLGSARGDRRKIDSSIGVTKGGTVKRSCEMIGLVSTDIQYKDGLAIGIENEVEKVGYFLP